VSTESDIPATLGAQLAQAERILASVGLSVPRDEALALLGSLLHAPTALLLTRPASRLSQSEVATYRCWVARRAAGEAIPFITGHLTFMGLELTVEPHIPLVPVEAQRVVEAALECARHGTAGELSAAEIDTGCGAVALALAAFEPRFARIYALDENASSLQVASANGARYLLNLVISWIEGDGLDAVPEPVDLIVFSAFEEAVVPHLTRLLEQAAAKLRPGGALICGLDQSLEPLVAEAFRRAVPGAQVWMDRPSQRFVVAVAQEPRHSDGAATFGTRR
jgi:SAM-dependent methyltransferase